MSERMGQCQRQCQRQCQCLLPASGFGEDSSYVLCSKQKNNSVVKFPYLGNPDPQTRTRQEETVKTDKEKRVSCLPGF